MIHMRKNHHLRHSIAAAVLLVAVFCDPTQRGGMMVVSAGWVLAIPPYDEECFLVRLPADMRGTKAIVGNLELIDDTDSRDLSADPLLAYIMEATRDERILWRSKKGDSRSEFAVPVTPGKGYWMCIQNSSHGPDDPSEEGAHPDFQTRLVGFTYSVRDLFERPAPLAFTSENRQDWIDKSADVEREINTLMNHHDYMKIRESNHRQVRACFCVFVIFRGLRMCIFPNL
jgi:hypothetical protein